MSPESAAGRPSPQIMRATYSQPQADATPAKAPVATHHHVPSPQPFVTPANRPSLPVGPPLTSLGRSHSLAGQHEVRTLLLDTKYALARMNVLNAEAMRDCFRQIVKLNVTAQLDQL